MARSKARDGQGTVKQRKLKDGATVYDAWAPPMRDPLTGQRIRPSKRGFRTETEARKWIAKQITDNTNGIKIVRKRGGLTVGDCLKGWSETSPLKKSTIAEYRREVERLASELLHEPVVKITRVDIDRIISAHRKNGVGLSGLIQLIIALGHIFDYAIGVNEIQVNPTAGSQWLKTLRRDARNRKAERDEELDLAGVEVVLTREQVRELIETERNPLYATFWEVSVSTGLRRSELLALRWADVDMEEGFLRVSENIADVDGELIHLDTPKGGRRRRIAIDQTTVDLLKAHKAAQARVKARWADIWEEHDLVFPVSDHRRGQRFPPGHWMAPNRLSQAFRRRARSLGFGTTKLHCLRFTWASIAYMRGVPIKTIQDHLGHALDVTTLVYIKTGKASKREAVTRVVDYLRGIA